MYIDYNMAEIALMFCAMSSLLGSVGGGFFMFKQEQDRKRIKDIEDNVGNAAAFVIYPECDYKGTPVITWKNDDSEKYSNIEVERVNPTGKSFILPSGYKMGVYSKFDKEGVKLPFKGPVFQRCTTIKGISGEWGTPPT